MTPSARIQAAIEVLDAWLSGSAVEQALTRWARGARYAGSKDRAAVRDHVFDVLRQKGSCAALGGGETGRALLLGLLRKAGQDPSDVFTGQRFAPSALTLEERELYPPDIDARMDVPNWLLPQFDSAFTDAVLDHMQRRAPLFLRVNARKSTPEVAITTLAGDGITTESDPRCPGALIVTEGGRKLRQSRAYSDGLVEPQDLSAQRAVAAVSWSQNGKILDYCAGGGGKTLAVADHSTAQLFAHDANPKRMTDLPGRAARAGIDVHMLDTGQVRNHAPFDAVLCDVPCSGSGTWRRDPEAKWHLTSGRINDLLSTQSRILEGAVDLVRPGGQLIYMTCSLLAAENEAQIEQFLAAHPGWHLVHIQTDTPLSASDGFFCAVLTRG